MENATEERVPFTLGLVLLVRQVVDEVILLVLQHRCFHGNKRMVQQHLSNVQGVRPEEKCTWPLTNTPLHSYLQYEGGSENKKPLYASRWDKARIAKALLGDSCGWGPIDSGRLVPSLPTGTRAARAAPLRVLHPHCLHCLRHTSSSNSM